MRRITLTITEAEREALYQLAKRERRDTRAQAAHELRRALEARGLLPAEMPEKTNVTEDGAKE